MKRGQWYKRYRSTESWMPFLWSVTHELNLDTLPFSEGENGVVVGWLWLLRRQLGWGRFGPALKGALSRATWTAYGKANQQSQKWKSSIQYHSMNLQAFIPMSYNLRTLKNWAHKHCQSAYDVIGSKVLLQRVAVACSAYWSSVRWSNWEPAGETHQQHWFKNASKWRTIHLNVFGKVLYANCMLACTEKAPHSRHNCQMICSASDW